MSSDWSEVRLGSHVDLLTGFPFKSSGFTAKDGVRLLRGDNVAQGVLRWDGAKRWPEAELDGLERYLLKEGDVIVAMDRPWIEAGLKYAQVSHLDVPSLLVQRVARLRSGLRLEQTYLRYLIGSPEFVRYVLSVQTGTAVPHISAGQIGAFRFMLPSLDEQRRIASVLGALDRKIQHNRRLATTAGHLVGTMFSHACLQLPTDGQEPLTSIADFKNGGAFTKHANGVGRPIIRIKELNDGVGDATPRTDHAVGDQHIARHDDLLFSWSGSLDVYRWDGPESIINQ